MEYCKNEPEGNVDPGTDDNITEVDV